MALAAKKSKRGFAAEKPKKTTEVEVLEAQAGAQTGETPLDGCFILFLGVDIGFEMV